MNNFVFNSVFVLFTDSFSFLEYAVNELFVLSVPTIH